MIYVAKIVSSTSVDGPGLRNSLYVSGCPIRCEGCHNSQWWDLHSGAPMTVKEVYDELTKDDFDISILGGEPIFQYEAVCKLCHMIKQNTQKGIWLWTGYTMKCLCEHYPEILRLVDTVVDGPYVTSLANPDLPWRGSSNQKMHHLNTISNLCENS